MLKNRIVIALCMFLVGSQLNAQKQIEIDNARLNPAPQTYGSGSNVAIPIKLNSCFAQTNSFDAVVLNSSNVPVSPYTSVSVFYATFINIKLPTTLATGNYKVAVFGNGGFVSDTSALFPVTNVAIPVVAKATPVISDLILLDQYYYGICDGNPLAGFSLYDSCSAGGTDSLILIDDYRIGNPITKFVPSVLNRFNLTFSPTDTLGGRYRDAYYTAYVKTISAGNILSTKAYHIINNSWDINTVVIAKAPGTTYSCVGDSVTIGISLDRSQFQHLQQNFPGAIINIDWNSGAPQNFTQCQIIAANGRIKKFYPAGSCSASGTPSFKITSTVTNPFNIFNGPGITGTCAAGAKTIIEASIFAPPKAKFNMDSVVCAMDTVKFINTSDPGQGFANLGGTTVCAQLANYTWVIDGNVGTPLYQSAKIELKKDTAYSFNSSQVGYHNVSLYINNNYGLQAPCPSHDTTKVICVDTAKVRPIFVLDSAGVGIFRDSLVGCAPVFCLKNMTRRTLCVDSTLFTYQWRVLDASVPGPNYPEIPESSGNFSYTSGNNSSREPCISINKTGKYFIELNANAKCLLDSSLRMLKYIEANGDAGVNFPIGSDTVSTCSYPIPLTIDYSPTGGFNTFLGLVDSVSYTYQASAGATLSYKWTITPGSYGVDYDTIGGTTTTSAYPIFRFYNPGLYKVSILFSNNCQPKTAVQYVAYRQPVVANAGGLIDSICHTTNSFNISGANTGTGGTVGQIIWSTTGTGTFLPAIGTPITPNIFNPTYIPSAADKALACDTGFTFTLTMSVFGVRPSNCAIVSSNRRLFVRPCVTVPNTQFNSCSGSAVNYSITKPGLVGSIFTWTSTVIAGIATGNTNNAVGSTVITDVLTGNGIVRYTLFPKLDGCVGNQFFLWDTVRPIPNKPLLTLLKPNNPTKSMCSGDTARIQMNGSSSSDLFSWTSRNHVGKITGLTIGSNLPSPIITTLINNTSPFLTDTATFRVNTTTKYGCVGPFDSTFIIVTPGPNVADISGNLIKYLCNLSCDTIKHNTPGAAGLGTFSLKFSNVAPNPTITNLNDSTKIVCGMKPGGTYKFEWKVAPVLAGCVTTTDSIEIQVTDSLPTPFAGMDTAFCDVNGVTQRVFIVNGSLSRPLLPTEFVYFNGVGPAALTTPYFFTNIGVNVVEMRVQNFVCVDKVDTMLVRAFTQPLGGSITVNPIQSSFCQGVPFTLTSNYDTSVGNIGRWVYQIFRPPFTTFNVGNGLNPFTFTPTESVGFQALIYSKGWSFGCKDSVFTSGYNINVDSTTIAGTISATDTIVCTPNTLITLRVNGLRGSVIGWLRSTTNATSGYGSGFALGNPVSVPVTTTTWYRALVRNGNCSIDTTPPLRIFLPSGAGAASTGNDTAVCNATSILLTGNTPLIGSGYWKMIQGLINTPLFGTHTFTAPPTGDTTSLNPINANIQQYGTYQFVWTIKNLTCDATADTITVQNTAPIINNAIGTTIDTVCFGTQILVTGTVPTGGSGIYNYTWEYSTNTGTTWSTGSLAANSYSFSASTNVWVRRVVKSDSCYSYSNIIQFIVHPLIVNNVITPAVPAICTNNLAPTINGTLPTGGNNSYTYVWNQATNINIINNLWTTVATTTQNYSPGINLVDTFCFRRIVNSGKCSDTSMVNCVTVYPDAKAVYTTNKLVSCAPFQILIETPLPPPLNTNYDWYATTGSPVVRTFIGSGAGFPGYTISTGLDSIKITLIATSTLGCKPDSTNKWFYTSATPFAAYTVNVDSGCANNTGLNTTTFTFTNTTANQGLFTYVFNYGNGSSTGNPNPLPMTYGPSSTGLDTIYTTIITATSPACGSSQFSIPIKIRTRPKVLFSLSPAYQCSGGPVTFTNQTVGSPNLTWNWNFGDGIGTSTLSNPTYIYNVTSITTEIPTLIATNECASDSAKNTVVIAANTVTLNISVKGTDRYKCLPDTVTFYSNSNGGTSYFWNFGDGTLSVPTSKGIDTVIHIYTAPGKYIVTLTGSTSCGTVTKTDSIYAYGTPIVGYTINTNTTICKGDTVTFTNLTDTATSYVWNFGNGTNSAVNPFRVYNSSGLYNVKLTAIRNHSLPLGGILSCIDTSSLQSITVRDTMPAVFAINPIGTSCLPYSVQFVNNTPISTLPISTTNWTFGVAGATSTSNPANYTYTALGQYNINLTVRNAGGCTYIDSQKIIVDGPIGTWTHDTGYVCNNTPVNFQINAVSTDTCFINFGDATPVVAQLYSTLPNPFTHVYTTGGSFIPTVTLKSVSGCTYFIGAMGTVRVDYVKATYTINPQVQVCGTTTLSFTNTSKVDQTPLSAVYLWNIAGTPSSLTNPSMTFNTTGVYNVRMQVTSVSGCFDSVATTPVFVKVNNIPNILSITRQDTACTGQTVYYTANTSISEDPIVNYNWNFGNGLTGSGISSNNIFGSAGFYFDTITIVTSTGCSSTLVSSPIVINGTPTVSINPSVDTSICLGAAIPLNAFSSGSTPISSYSWYPPISLNTTVGSSVIASPTSSTKYVVTGTSARGCTDTASININVVQPYTVTVTAAPRDSVCLGESVVLTANGAATYLWTPALGLDVTTGPRVVATPNATTVYTVTGTNAANCFPNTSASISIGIGDTTKISLGADTVRLQGGSTFPLTPSITNGPIASWNWTPATDLSCSDCGNPIASVKSNICYNVEATSIYGCKAYDDICIIAFCEASQVFIPNAFTPDGDGVNDYLWIKARGIKQVKSFRIFSRWGQVVFERANFVPVDFDRINSWDGKIKGVIAPTDVYVYTCEVVCENGSKFTYTGNISVIK